MLSKKRSETKLEGGGGGGENIFLTREKKII